MNTRTQTFGRTSKQFDSFQTKKESDIIYSIATDDLEALRNLLSEKNVNDVIDSKNNYYALHYAIKFNNDKMIDYLLSIGANPYLKTTENLDAFDIALKYQNKSIFNFSFKEKDIKIDDLKQNISSLDRKISTLSINNKYLTKSVDDFILRTDILKKEANSLKNKNESLIIENNTLQASKCSLEEKYNNSCKKFDNLKNENAILKNENSTMKNENSELNGKINSLKRKYNELNDSYDGLLQKIKK